MKNPEFYEAVRRIMSKDARYHPDAYEFMSDAVIYTAKVIETKLPERKSRHISGPELILGVIEYATKKFGPLAYEVLCEWNIRNGASVGTVVFNMLEYNLLSKTEEDSKEDFNVPIDFEKSLKAPFTAPPFFSEEQMPTIA